MAAPQAKRGAAAASSLSSSAAAAAASNGAIAHDRWIWILSVLVGQHVTATTKDGVRIKGILSAATPEGGDLSIAIRQAVTLPSPPSTSTSAPSSTESTNAPPKPLVVIQGRDLVQLEAADAQIDLTGTSTSSRAQSPAAGPASSSSTERDSFRTDTDISRATQLGKERQLQAWGTAAFLGDSAGGIEDDAGALEGGLEDSVRGNQNGYAAKGRASRGGPGGGGGGGGQNGGGAGGWDQFAANERAFGLRTDYDDEIYTTRLDRSTADFKQREARAAQLEREILKGSTSSALAHNAHVAEERGEQMPDLNEEERYGAVIRELPPATEGAYVPPGARKAALARLQLQNGAGGASPIPTTIAPPVGSEGPAPAGLLDPAIVGTSSSSTPLASSTSSSSATPATGAAASSSTPSKPNPNAKPYDRSMQEFVTAERVRLEQKRNQMQQAQQHSQHQAQIKKEHDSKLASLLQWSQTFKNPYPMPDDVAELLRKKPAATAAAATATSSTAAGTAGQAPTVANGDAKSASTTVSPAAGPKPLPTLGSSVKPPPSQSVKITKPIVLEIPPFDPNRAKAKQAALAAQKAGGGTAAPDAASPSSAAAAASTSGSGATAAPAAGAAAKKLSATSAAFVFKPNPAAASFTPGASTSARRPSATSAAPAAAAAPSAPASAAAAPEPPKLPVNPFFGTKQIKKGSSSMHVKEDFTPFKNGVLPEPSTVPPAWPFTGKSYRSIYPIPPQGPLDDGSGGMMDPNGPAAMAAAQAVAAAQAAAAAAQQQAQAQAAHAHALAAAGMPINMLPGPPPQMMAMSAGGGISGSPASMPPPLPPQGAHMHPHQPQPPMQHFAGMYAHHPHHPGHAPAFNPAAMGFAPRPGGGGGMPQMNAAGPGPQFQPHHMQQQHGGGGGGNGQQGGPPYFGQPGGPPQQMHGFVPGGGNGGPPHGAQMLSSPHMPQSTTHSPRVTGPNHPGGRGNQGGQQQQQQQPMPWTPPQFVPGGPNGGPHGQGQGGYPQQQQPPPQPQQS